MPHSIHIPHLSHSISLSSSWFNGSSFSISLTNNYPLTHVLKNISFILIRNNNTIISSISNATHNDLTTHNNIIISHIILPTDTIISTSYNIDIIFTGNISSLNIQDIKYISDPIPKTYPLPDKIELNVYDQTYQIIEYHKPILVEVNNKDLIITKIFNDKILMGTKVQIILKLLIQL